MARWTEFLHPDAPDGRYLRWREVEARVGISRTTAWRLQKAGDFPAPYVISTGRVGYRESEIEAWQASRAHRGEPASAGSGPGREQKPTESAPSVIPASHRPFPPGRVSAASAPARLDPRRLSRRGGTQTTPDGQATFDF